MTSKPARVNRPWSRASGSGNVSTAIRGGAIPACQTIVNASRSIDYAFRETGADYRETLVVDHRGKKGTAARLAQLLGVAARNVRSDGGSPGGPDVTVVLGADYRGVS